MQAAQARLEKVEAAIKFHNSHPPPNSDSAAVLLYNNEADFLNNWAAQLQGQLNSANAQYTPATTANTLIPSWVNPVPPPTPKSPPPPYHGYSTPPLLDEVPLQTDLTQIEEKYSQKAPLFGVTDPRGRAGFDKFADALKQFLHDPSTLHIDGSFHGDHAILNVNPDTQLVVIQSPDGKFISAWKLSPGQFQNVLNRGSL